MRLLTADMKRVVAEQRLGFVATVCPDGTPNLSPKGTIAVWDDDYLVFASRRVTSTSTSPRSMPPNHTFDRTARQRGWRVPSSRGAAAAGERGR
jgi:hypothetical protein